LDSNLVAIYPHVMLHNYCTNFESMILYILYESFTFLISFFSYCILFRKNSILNVGQKLKVTSKLTIHVNKCL
jgi:hypothetical protein